MPSGSASSTAMVVESVDAAATDPTSAGSLGEDLFAVATLLDSQPALRRVLTEPSVEADAKARLVADLLGDSVGEPARSVLSTAVRQRWSQRRNLADALERAGVEAHLIAAEAAGQLDNVEDDLFRFERIVAAEPGLQDALSNRLAPVEAKRQLVDDLVEGKVSEPTRRLLDQVIRGRERSFPVAVESLQRIAAARRGRLVATVRVAAALSEDQEQRLAAALEHLYGKAVHLNVVVDPGVLGGVRVAVGDEVIDSTIAARLAETRRQLVD